MALVVTTDEYHAAHQLRPTKPMRNHTYARSSVAAAKLHASVVCDRPAQPAKQPTWAAQLKWLMSNEERVEEVDEEEDNTSVDIRGGYRRAASAQDAQEAYRAALHRFKVDKIVAETEEKENAARMENAARKEARAEEKRRRSPRKVTYASSARGLVLARTAKAEYFLTADDLALLDVTVVGGGRLFDIRRERRYYDPDDLKALAERKHGTRGLARMQAKAPALESLTSPNAGKRKRTRSDVEGEGGSEEAHTAQRTEPVRRSARLIDMLALGSHFIAY
tara:strand:- start:217 stop:1053 length:837 start_codon:yes stop_codon:yes gene_type:complete